MENFTLPTDYTSLTPFERRKVREQYISIQKGLCYYCGEDLCSEPPKRITDKTIN